LNPGAAELYAVGRIVKVFGIRGEVVVIPMTDSPERFESIKRLYIGKTPGAVQEHRIERSMIRPHGVRLKLEHVEDRSHAQTLVGSLLFVHGNELKHPAKGSYFIHDVVGLTVIDQDGVAVGTVRDVIRQANHDIYAVQCGDREVLIPAVREFIRKIDLQQRTMTVFLIEGMMA
jgi:16S rRNA processing protein RimM